MSIVALLAMGAVVTSLDAISETQGLLERSIRSMRNADRSAISLLQELVEDDPAVRSDLRRATYVYLDRIRRLTNDPDELALITDAERAVARYYAAEPEDPASRVLLVEAFDRIAALVELNINQATQAMSDARELTRSTRFVAAGTALTLLGGFVLVVLGLQVSAYRPFLELVQ